MLPFSFFVDVLPIIIFVSSCLLILGAEKFRRSGMRKLAILQGSVMILVLMSLLSIVARADGHWQYHRMKIFVHESLRQLEQGQMPVTSELMDEEEELRIREFLNADFHEDMEVEIIDNFFGSYEFTISSNGKPLYYCLIEGAFPLYDLPFSDAEFGLWDLREYSEVAGG